MKFSQKIKWTMIVAGVLAIGLATLLFASSFTAPTPDTQLYKNTEKIYMMTSSGRLVSVDAKSGQKNYLCTTPDCPHTEDECDLVAEEEGFGIYVTDSHVFYVRKGKGDGMWSFALWQYDMESGKASCVFDEGTCVNNLSHYGNYLFFNSSVDVTEADGGQVSVNKYDLYRYDVTDGSVEKMNRDPLDAEQYLEGVEDGAYCWTQMGERFLHYITDKNYENRSILHDTEDYAPYYTVSGEYRLVSRRTGTSWIFGEYTLERENLESGKTEAFVPRCGSYKVVGGKVVYLLPLDEPVKIGEYVNEQTGEIQPVYDYYRDCLCIGDIATGEVKRVDYDPEALGGEILSLGGDDLDGRYFCVFARTLRENATYADYEVGGQYVFDVETCEFTVVG